MTSMLHEGLLLLFRNQPQLAVTLLQTALETPLPSGPARILSADFNEVAPTEYRADLVLTVGDGASKLAIVLEIQLGRDRDKPWSWPVYLTTLRARLRCPVALLVVTPDRRIAAWARKPIALGPGGFVLSPIVMGPEAIPHVDAATAAANPELAVLSVMAHAEATTLPEALAATSATLGLDEERSRLYIDLVMMALPAAMRAALEKQMDTGKYEYQSEFARRYVAIGKAEGKAEGEARGKEEGKREALLGVLEARGVEVDGDARARIQACTDPIELQTWITRAVSAPSVAAVFAPELEAVAPAKKAKKPRR